MKTDNFFVPDIIFKLRSKRVIKVSSFILYTHLCCLYNKCNKNNKYFYVSSKTLIDVTNFKRSTVFSCKKELREKGLISTKNKGYIKINHLKRYYNEI